MAAGFGTTVAKEIESGVNTGTARAATVIGAAERDIGSRTKVMARDVGAGLGGIAPAAAKAGKNAGEELDRGVAAGGARAAREGEKAGEEVGGRFGRSLKLALRGAVQTITGLGLELGPFNEGMVRASEKIEEVDKKSGAATGTIARLGRTTALVGVASFLAFSAGAAKMGNDFQTATSQMAANANIPIRAAQNMARAFTSEGPNIIYTAQQQVEAYAKVGAQLNAVQGHALSTKEAVEFMRQSMDLAEESGTNLGSATQDLSQIMQTFQVPLDQTGKVTTQLFNASRITNVSVDALASTMDRLKARMGVAAPTVGDMAALITDLGEHGVTGSRGLLVINSAMNTLLASTGKLDTAQAKAADTQGKKVAAAQAAVQKATQALANAQQGAGVAGASKLSSASDTLARAQQRLGLATTAQTASSSRAVTAATDSVARAQQRLQQAQEQAARSAGGSAAAQQSAAMAVQRAQLSLGQAQDKLNQLQHAGAVQSGSVVSAQYAVQTAQDRLAASQGKGAGASSAVARAQQTLAAAEAKLQAAQSGTAKIANANVAAMSKLGLTVYDAHGRFVGFRDVIAQLQPRLEKMTQAQQLQTLAAVFGSQANKSLLDTVLAGPAAWDRAQRAVNNQEAAHHALEVQEKTLGHEMESVRASVANMATVFGLRLLPVIQAALHGFGQFVGFLQQHTVAMYAFGAAVGAVLAGAVAVWLFTVGEKMVAATGRAISAAGKLAEKIGGMFGRGEVAQANEQAAANDRIVAATDRAALALGRENTALAEAQAALERSVAATGEFVAAQERVLQLTSEADGAFSGEGLSLEELSAQMDQMVAQADLAAAANERLAASADAVAAGPMVGALEEEGAALGGAEQGSGRLAGAFSRLGDAARNVGGRVKAIGSGLADFAANAGRQAIETTERLAVSFGRAAAQAGRAALAIAIKTARTVAMAVADGAAAAAEGVAAAASAILDVALAPITLTIGAIVLAVAALGFGIYELVTHWKAVWGALRAAAEAFGRFITKWWPELLIPLTGGLSLVAKFIIDHWQAIWNTVKRAFDDFTGFIRRWWPLLIGVFLGPIGIAVGLFVRFRTQIVGEAERLGRGVVGFVAGIPREILGLFAHAGDLLLKAGRDIIGGLVKGIESVPVLGSVAKIGTGILGHFKSLFHIFSPSQVMADQVGAPLVEGMAQGINANSHSVTAALQQLGGAATGILRNLQGPMRQAAKLIGQSFGDMARAVEAARDRLRGGLGQLADAMDAFGRAAGRAVGPVRDAVRPFQTFSQTILDIGSHMTRAVAPVVAFEGVLTAFVNRLRDSGPGLVAFAGQLALAAPTIARMAPLLDRAEQPLGRFGRTLRDISGPLRTATGRFEGMTGAMRDLGGEGARFSGQLDRLATSFGASVARLSLFAAALSDVERRLRGTVDPLGVFVARLRSAAEPLQRAIGPMRNAVQPLQDFARALEKTALGLTDFAGGTGRFLVAVARLHDETTTLARVLGGLSTVAHGMPPVLDRLTGAFQRAVNPIRSAAQRIADALGPIRAVTRPLDDFGRAAGRTAAMLDRFADGARRFSKSILDLAVDNRAFAGTLVGLEATARAVPGVLQRMTDALARYVGPMRRVASDTRAAIGPLRDTVRPLNDFAGAARRTADALDRFRGRTADVRGILPPVVKQLDEARRAVDNMRASTGLLLTKGNWDHAAADIKAVWKTISDSTMQAWGSLGAFFRRQYAQEVTETDRAWTAIRNAVLRQLYVMVVEAARTAGNMGTVITNIASAAIRALAARVGQFRQVGQSLAAALVQGMAQGGAGVNQAFAGIRPPGAPPGAPVFQQGGPVPGTGPQLAVVHGGEFVLSAAQVRGLTTSGIAALGPQAATALGGDTAASAPAAPAAAAATPGGTPLSIQQIFNTPMSPAAVANELGWLLRTAAVTGGIRTVL